VVNRARSELKQSIEGLSRDDPPPGLDEALPAKNDPHWTQAASAEAHRLVRPGLQSVINATGIVLHTNLGRAPLAAGAAEAAAGSAVGYCDLELDLDTGKRGNRLGGVSEKLCLLSGAEAATACNNNAAAVLLILNTLAQGREVIVSRGELVEIGGSFRVPEVMERAGVRLVEVGTTNRTHLRDYERAIGPDTGLLLKVHRSNFEQRGFVTDVGINELARVGSERGLPVVEDLGSGTLLDLTEAGLPLEAYAPSRLRLGADLVCFSGDKLLGGPQAGLILGASRYVAALCTNPLARALRLDKMTLAALDWTLAAMLAGDADEKIPLLRQLLVSSEVLEARAHELANRLQAVAGPAAKVEVVADRTPLGGGTLPGFELDGWVVALRSDHAAERIAERLRQHPTPVLVRVRDAAVLFDPRTLVDGDVESISAALPAALR
jgi:L-seryl-tRNA(Ser) seleniumtransferase